MILIQAPTYLTPASKEKRIIAKCISFSSSSAAVTKSKTLSCLSGGRSSWDGSSVALVTEMDFYCVPCTIRAHNPMLLWLHSIQLLHTTPCHSVSYFIIVLYCACCVSGHNIEGALKSNAWPHGRERKNKDATFFHSISTFFMSDRGWPLQLSYTDYRTLQYYSVHDHSSLMRNVMHVIIIIIHIVILYVL